MDERSAKRNKRDHDFSAAPFRVTQEATADADDTPVPEDKPLNTEAKNPNAVTFGRLGAKKGRIARAAKLTPEQRRDC